MIIRCGVLVGLGALLLMGGCKHHCPACEMQTSTPAPADEVVLSPSDDALTPSPVDAVKSTCSISYLPIRYGSHDETFTCPACGAQTVYSDFVTLRRLRYYRSKVKALRAEGLDVQIDETAYCSVCSQLARATETFGTLRLSGAKVQVFESTATFPPNGYNIEIAEGEPVWLPVEALDEDDTIVQSFERIRLFPSVESPGDTVFIKGERVTRLALPEGVQVEGWVLVANPQEKTYFVPKQDVLHLTQKAIANAWIPKPLYWILQGRRVSVQYDDGNILTAHMQRKQTGTCDWAPWYRRKHLLRLQELLGERPEDLKRFEPPPKEFPTEIEIEGADDL